MGENDYYSIAVSETAVGLFGNKDKSRWLSAFATLDEICVDGGIVEASGAYTANGEYYTAQIKREFVSPFAAEAWAAQLEANPKVTVKFDPDKPEKYVLEDLPA